MISRFFSPAVLLAAALLATATTTATAACPHAKLITHVYQVADLITPLPDLVVGDQDASLAKRSGTTEDRLMSLIRHSIQPASWRSNGGDGCMDFYPLGTALIVRQAADVHEQIADLLATLRKQQDVQVALEVRFVSVPEGFLERCAKQADCGAGEKGLGSLVKPEDRPRFLSDLQVASLLEAAQADRRTNVLQAPKLTMANGQQAVLQLAATQFFDSGLRLMALPVVSADQRSVRLSLEIEAAAPSKDRKVGEIVVPIQKAQTGSIVFGVGVNSDQGLTGGVVVQERNFDLQQSPAIGNTVTIPDGGTVLFSGLKRVVETPVPCGPPVLGTIPYMNRFFHCVGTVREKHDVLVLMTPRILVVPEEEERKPALTPCPVGTQPTGAIAGKCLLEMTAACVKQTGFLLPRCAEQENPETAAQGRQAQVLAELLKAYDEACAAGHATEAKKYARAALAIDPTCFRR